MGTGEVDIKVENDFEVGDMVRIRGPKLNGTYVIKSIRYNYDIGEWCASVDLPRRRGKKHVDDKWYLKYAKGTAR